MAKTVYLRAAGTGSWNTDASWSTTSSAGAANTTKPVAGDTAILDSGSTVNCTIDVQNQACAILTCTGYTYGLIMTTYSMNTTGNVTLVSGMTFTKGTATWNMGCATVALATGGKHFNNLNFNVAGTLTLSDACYVDGILSVASSITATLATSDITCGGLTVTGTGSIAGVGRMINLTGGTWQSGYLGSITTDLTITGSVIISGNVYYRTGILNSQGATLTTTGSTLNFTGSCIFTDNVNTWVNLNFTTTTTLTLSQNTVISGTLSCSNAIITIASHTISVSGNLTQTLGGLFAGQTITMTGNVAGTATWSAGTGKCTCNIVFAGGTNTITISGAVGIQNATLTYTSGAMVTTGSTLYVVGATGGSTIATENMTWNTIAFYYSTLAVTHLITGNLNCASLQVCVPSTLSIYACALVLSVTNGKTITVTANLQILCGVLQAASGTCNLNYTGPQSGNNCAYAVFTNVDASGSRMRIWNWNGGTLTNCTNILNITGANVGGSGCIGGHILRRDNSG